MGIAKSRLSEAAFKYWRVSRAYNGTGPSLTTSNGMKLLREAVDSVGPHRAVSVKANRLLGEIILGSELKDKKTGEGK